MNASRNGRTEKSDDFLTVSPWQGPVVLQTAARQVLALLAPQPGEWLEAILYSTRV